MTIPGDIFPYIPKSCPKWPKNGQIGPKTPQKWCFWRFRRSPLFRAKIDLRTGPLDPSEGTFRPLKTAFAKVLLNMASFLPTSTKPARPGQKPGLLPRNPPNRPKNWVSQFLAELTYRYRQTSFLKIAIFWSKNGLIFSRQTPKSAKVLKNVQKVAKRPFLGSKTALFWTKTGVFPTDPPHWTVTRSQNPRHGGYPGLKKISFWKFF